LHIRGGFLPGIARAKSVSMIEDLGVQMNVHSTLNSYLNRLVWLLTGNYAKPGSNNAFVPLLSLSTSNRGASKGLGAGKPAAQRKWTHSPVTGSKVIMGLIPCNVMLDELATIDSKLPPHRPGYPFILSAGERRADTSNTSIRNPEWLKKGSFGVLRIHPQDAAALGCEEGDWVQLRTPRRSAQALVELTDGLQQGHVSLPNGHGLDYHQADGTLDRRGLSVNELTNTTDRDPFAGTPCHKYVPVHLERLTPACSNCNCTITEKIPAT
jgi:anaerobic selenocysteine-containing dehydrogenase